MKILNGRELAEYIKERQAKQVRALRQAHHVFPKLAIVQTVDNPVIDAYVRLKQRYGTDILVEVEPHKVEQYELISTINQLNEDPAVHGIIVQLPLADEAATDEAVNTVAPRKDVDGLGANAMRDPATPLAISWLVAGYNVNLVGKRIAIVGNGRLVGRPLTKMWRDSGYDVTVFDRSHAEQLDQLRAYDIVVTAVGVPSLIVSKYLKIGAVVVDAGTAAEHGKIVGDLAADVRARDDLVLTPEKGGVGPLTVTALFDNVIQAATDVAKSMPDR